MMYLYKKLNVSGLLLTLAASPLLGLQINEIRVDEPGATDSNEYFEINGNPGESLDGVWYLVLGDHSSFGSDDNENIPDKRGGVVEFAISLEGFTLPADGIFLVASSNMQIELFNLGIFDVDYLVTDMNFENSDNVTHMLVRGYKGTEVTDYADQYDDLAVDIDDDDDGVPNATLPWDSVVDAIGLLQTANDNNPEEFGYGAAFGGVDIGPAGSFRPQHVFRGSDDDEWNIGVFNLINESGDGLFEGNQFDGPALDTPGAENPVTLTESRIFGMTPNLVIPGAVITLVGENFDTVETVTVGNVEVSFTIIDDNTIEYLVSEDVEGGFVTVTGPNGSDTAEVQLSLIAGNKEILFFEDFEGGDLGTFSEYSVSSEYTWEYRVFSDNGYAQMSGFGDSDIANDWLISPEISIAEGSEAFLNFTTARRFTGPELKVYLGTDYVEGDPTNATWTELDVPLSPDAFYVVTSSGDIDLSPYAGDSFRVAFQYTSTGTESGQSSAWQVDNVIVFEKIEQEGFYLFEDFLTSLGDFFTVSLASDADWGLSGGGGAQISGYRGDVPSNDWLISPEVDLTGAVEPVLVFSTSQDFADEFAGSDFEVLISKDYDGTIPSNATWEVIDAPLSDGNALVVSSGDIDLSAYIGETIYIAFHYTSGTAVDEAPTWKVNEVIIREDAFLDEGWNDNAMLGWIYNFTAEWSYHPIIGFMHMAEYPWIYSMDESAWYYLYEGNLQDGLWVHTGATWGWVIKSGNDLDLFLGGPDGFSLELGE